MKLLMEIFAENVKKRLLSNGWSQNDLAEKTGLTRQTISAYCNAKQTVVVDGVAKIAAALNSTPEQLFQDANSEELNPVQREAIRILDETIARLTAKPEPASPMLRAAEMPLDERAVLNAELQECLKKLPVHGVRQSLMLVQAVVDEYEEAAQEKAKKQGKDTG